MWLKVCQGKTDERVKNTYYSIISQHFFSSLITWRFHSRVAEKQFSRVIRHPTLRVAVNIDSQLCMSTSHPIHLSLTFLATPPPPPPRLFTPPPPRLFTATPLTFLVILPGQPPLPPCSDKETLQWIKASLQILTMFCLAKGPSRLYREERPSYRIEPCFAQQKALQTFILSAVQQQWPSGLSGLESCLYNDFYLGISKPFSFQPSNCVDILCIIDKYTDTYVRYTLFDFSLLLRTQASSDISKTYIIETSG